MPTVWTEVEVDVELTEFDTEDLIEELENRGESSGSDTNLIRTIYEKRRIGQDYQKELDELIYKVTGSFI
jgi:hypothetical protein